MLSVGVLKERPLWLDVLEAFPPLIPPQHNRSPEAGLPPVLTYPEDKQRR